MFRITSSTHLLNDTLQLVRLARETAIAQGNTSQFKRLQPVVDDLKKVSETARQTPPSSSTAMKTLKTNGFGKLLEVASSNEQPSSTQAVSPAERNQVVIAMSAGGMNTLDIARQMGMARNEVRTLLQIDHMKNNSNRAGGVIE